MKYKEILTDMMGLLATNKDCRFIGYNVKYGSKANGTLKNIDDKQLIETPIAENLMVGMAIGMAIDGLRPVVYFERFDFIMNAMDAIVNHLDKIKTISNGEYDPKVIIRVNIGGTKKPLYTGITHTQDFTEAMIKLVTFPVVKLDTISKIQENYTIAAQWKSSMMLIEERDRFDEEE
jgi:pyruvate/2-oxoglutarate/acetoin dehydrogenase E1 component